MGLTITSSYSQRTTPWFKTDRMPFHGMGLNENEFQEVIPLEFMRYCAIFQPWFPRHIGVSSLLMESGPRISDGAQGQGLGFGCLVRLAKTARCCPLPGCLLRFAKNTVSALSSLQFVAAIMTVNTLIVRFAEMGRNHAPHRRLSTSFGQDQAHQAHQEPRTPSQEQFCLLRFAQTTFQAGDAC